MLTHVTLENFRAFGARTAIPLAPITLLFGENSAGKTSVLHALALLKQSWESQDQNVVLAARDYKGLVDLGSFREFVHDHDTERVLRIGLVGKSRASTSGSARLRLYGGGLGVEKAGSGHESEFGIEFAFGQTGSAGDVAQQFITLLDFKTGSPKVQFKQRAEPEGAGMEGLGSRFAGPRTRYTTELSTVSRESLQEFTELWRANAHIVGGLLKDLRASPQYSVGFMEFDEPEAMKVSRSLLKLWRDVAREDVSPTEILEVLREESRVPRLIAGRFVLAVGVGLRRFLQQASEIAKKKEEKAALQAVADHFLAAADVYATSSIVQAREALSRYAPIGPFRQPAERLYTYSGTRPRQVGRSGELVSDLLHRDPELLGRTNDWLKKFGIDYKLKLKPLGGRHSDVFEVRLVDQRRRPKIDIAFTDVGFGISQMLPIVVQSVTTKGRIISIEQPEVHIHPRLQAEIGDLLVDCSRQNRHQFLVETHSEHLILRLRRLVREGKVSPSEISVIHVGRGKSGAVIEPIGLKPDGTFDREWPGGFFPERMRELL
jgi:hypothetical protein